MRTRGDKRPSRKNDHKVLMAEESTKIWADTDSDSSSGSSSSSDSEQDEVHCLMANQTSDDEVFDFSNIEFTREDLVSALNDMVKEYRKLCHSFEEIKAENENLKNSSIESSTDTLEDIDSLKIELKLQAKLAKEQTGQRQLKSMSKSFVPNQSWRSSKKVKSGWKKVQKKRDLSGQSMKSKLNRSHCNYAQTLTDSSTGKTVKSTGCVLGKCVYLLTLVMSLFDLQDVCIVIGSLATLDLPMVVDLIGIYVLKGPYCTLTTTNWFLQALSMIPRGSWGDVARRFTMIRWHPPLPLPHDPSAAAPLRRRRVPPPSWLDLFRPPRGGDSVRAKFVRPSSSG
ncbi:hypothetical protein F511_23857 [Dorcoceras hygrometricum]|uniref:Uncharacterized protein n=1 Tax=Dorcoceras hygrometricum TaxID=472368 RepID=A0A2Z7AXD8_9LAMI|nr:hypothetical protein F511_23857 [Dorcoceras hygrometricum]